MEFEYLPKNFAFSVWFEMIHRRRSTSKCFLFIIPKSACQLTKDLAYHGKHCFKLSYFVGIFYSKYILKIQKELFIGMSLRYHIST